jgi:hypothetical protein
MSWWKKSAPPRPSREAVEALRAVREDLHTAHAFHAEVHRMSEAAEETLAQNHFGAAVTAAMGGRIHND